MTAAALQLSELSVVKGATTCEVERLAKLEALLNATENAVITTDTDGKIASLNLAAEAMFGFEPGESVGWPMARLISTDAAMVDGGALARSPDGNGRRKDGSEFPLEVSRAAWTDSQGRVASGAVLRDITERRRAEAESRRQEAAAQTRDKFAALGRIAGGVAHELNNLLQPIIGLTQLELDSPGDQVETRENLEMILESAVQARDVVRKSVMFARKAKPELAPVDFPAALRRTLASLGELLPPGIHVDQVIDGGAVGFAKINEAELAEVATNLAVNAADAMDGRGTMTIHLDRVVLSNAAASLGMVEGPCFRISVADTGHGMDEATKAQIFEPFFTTKPVGQGTGLGLSMAYGVLHDWQGAITIDSTEGGGSTFTLYVPVTENP